MSFRLSAVHRLAVLSLVGVATAAAPARAALLPKEIRESEDPAANVNLITTYVNDQVTKLLGANADAAQTARKELAENVRTSPVIAPSAQFKDIYSAALNTALTNPIKSPDVNVRLTTAIVAAQVAAETRSPALRGVISTAIEDKNPAVCLWGVKGAGKVLPQVLANNLAAQNERLTAGVVASVQRFGNTTAIVDDAYAAGEMGLSQDALDPTINVKAVAPKAIDVTQKLLRERVQDYAAAPASQPLLEADAIRLLTRARIWQEHSPAQKLATVELALHVLKVTAHRLNDPQVVDRQGLISSIQFVSGGLSVALGNGNPGLAAALGRLAKLGPNPQAPAVLAAIDALYPQVRGIKEYAAVTNPPAVVPAAATAPTTAPAPAPKTPVAETP